MKKPVMLLLAIVGVVGAFALYYIAQGFMEAARHGGSPAARERRLSAISKRQNVGLPKQYGEGTVMIATKAGPGLRFTYVFQLVNVTRTEVDVASLAAKAKTKLIEIYKTNPEAANFRKWEVELGWQYLDKDGSEITTIAVTPKDLGSNHALQRRGAASVPLRGSPPPARRGIAWVVRQHAYYAHTEKG